MNLHIECEHRNCAGKYSCIIFKFSLVMVSRFIVTKKYDYWIICFNWMKVLWLVYDMWVCYVARLKFVGFGADFGNCNFF